MKWNGKHEVHGRLKDVRLNRELTCFLQGTPFSLEKKKPQLSNYGYLNIFWKPNEVSLSLQGEQ